MRVIMLSWEYPPNIVGGISRHVEELADALSARDLEIHVITSQFDGAPDYEDINGVNIHRVKADGDRSDFLPWIKSLNYYTELKASEIIEKNPKIPTLLHAHDWLSKFAGEALKKKHKIPLVGTIHATEHGRNYGIYTDLQRHISHLEWELTYESWRVIGCSEYMRGEISRVLAVPAEKIDVIPNGVDAKKFDFDFPDADEFRAKYAAHDEKIIFHAGRDVREKGAQTLIDAFNKVLGEYPKAKLVIVGGKSRQWLKDQVAALGIGDKVYFTGFVPDDVLLKIYKVSDIAVFPSYYEPFGIVALEAMAAKVPVIVSDVCGLKEIVDHEINGITTYAQDANSVAWGIMRFINMAPEQREAIIEAAYLKATTVFSWERIAEQTQDVYNRVMEEYKTVKWK